VQIFGFHETFAVKKLVMLASIGLCGLSTIAAVSTVTPDSKAPSAPVATAAAPTSTPAATTPTAPASAVEATSTTTTAAPATNTAPAIVTAAPAKPKAKAPVDTPETQRLIGLYPDLIKRISAYGTVCVQGKTCDVVVAAPAAAPAAGGAPRSGEEVYSAVCTNCHATGMLGSPMFGDKAAWSPRIAKGKDTLYTHAINGFNAMPARGGGELSDQEVKNGVDYMVSKAS
jgi:cytochrome c5